jgi:hypothetical protein
MPYLIEKLSNGKYRVSNSLGHIFAKGTTLKRAESQVRFLHMIDRVQQNNPDWWKSYKAR